MMMQEGLVLRFQSGFFAVQIETGLITCNIRGRLKSGPRQSDIIAIGDHVRITVFPDQTGVIEEVLPRKNSIVRLSTGLKIEYKQVLIANLDQILLVFSAKQPEPRMRMLDRFLVICERQGVPPVIVVNKMDLADELAIHAQFDVYPTVGYPVIYTSAVDERGVEQLRALLTRKVTGLIGPSGVGKSSLINRIDPALDLRVNDVSEFNQKGKHTTVVREMFPLVCGGYIADLPGVKTVGLWDIEAEEIDGYFPEIRPLVKDCYYSDCTHHPDEEGCAVHVAVESGKINRDRYESYLRIRFGDEEE